MLSSPGRAAVRSIQVCGGHLYQGRFKSFPIEAGMLTDFYGRVVVPPTEVAHNRVELAAMVAQVRIALSKFELRAVVQARRRFRAWPGS